MHLLSEHTWPDEQSAVDLQLWSPQLHAENTSVAPSTSARAWKFFMWGLPGRTRYNSRMTFEEHGERLVIRHKARSGFLTYMLLIALFLLPCSVLMFVVNVSSPRNISLTCVRAKDECTVSPVSAGWDSRTFPLSQLGEVHVEGSGRKTMIFLGDKEKSPHHQLSNESGSSEIGAEYKRAVEQAHAFQSGTEPTLKILYPSGEQGMPWFAAVLTFLFALVWIMQVIRAPKGLEVIVDRSTREMQVNRKFWRRTDSQTIPLDQIVRIAVSGSRTNMSLTIVALVLQDSKTLILFDEAAFSAAKQEAEQLVQKLHAFVGLQTASS
jgi:hypothetical protein